MTSYTPTLPNHIEDNETYKRAVVAMKATTAKEGVEYGWVLEYAKTRYEHCSKILSILDDKADGIIRYLGGGTGLFALGALSKIDSANSHLVWWSLPAIFAALVSLWFAWRVRKARTVPSLPSVLDAKENYAEGCPTDGAAKAAFLGQWNLYCEGTRVECHAKAALLDRATCCYFIALVLLVLPLIAAAIWPPLQK